MVSKRWLPRHALLLAAIAVCLLLGRWQLSRADAGNARSVGYAFEWPLFAAFAIWWWWRVMRLELHPPAPAEPMAEPRTAVRSVGMGAAAAPDEPDDVDQPDDELAAYNRHLAWLHARDQRSAR